jgi:hypothetical protein
MQLNYPLEPLDQPAYIDHLQHQMTHTLLFREHLDRTLSHLLGEMFLTAHLQDMEVFSLINLEPTEMSTADHGQLEFKMLEYTQGGKK